MIDQFFLIHRWEYIRYYSLRFIVDMGVWSYASHRAQCGVTTSHSTCCGYFVRDFHISFRLFTLSNPSVPTLCMKYPRSGANTIQPDLLLTVWWYEWLDCLANQRREEPCCLTKTKNRFYWNTFVRQWITNKRCLLSWRRGNGNKRVPHNPQNSWTEASPSNAHYCHTGNTISIWLIDASLIGKTTPVQSGSGSNDNERFLHIPLKLDDSSLIIRGLTP